MEVARGAGWLWGAQASCGEVLLGAAGTAGQMRLGRLAKHGRLGPARRCVARTLLNAVINRKQ
jgi:hypothetical protein